MFSIRKDGDPEHMFKLKEITFSGSMCYKNTNHKNNKSKRIKKNIITLYKVELSTEIWFIGTFIGKLLTYIKLDFQINF